MVGGYTPADSGTHQFEFTFVFYVREKRKPLGSISDTGCCVKGLSPEVTRCYEKVMVHP